MRTLFIILIGLLIQSCTTPNDQKEPFKSLLKNCDQVDILYYNNGDTLHFKTKDSNGIKMLAHLITGSNEMVPDSCQPVGELYYRRINDTLLTAKFSTSTITNKKKCDYISYSQNSESYSKRLTDKVGRLLNGIYASAQKPADSSLNKSTDTLK